MLSSNDGKATEEVVCEGTFPICEEKRALIVPQHACAALHHHNITIFTTIPRVDSFLLFTCM